MLRECEISNFNTSSADPSMSLTSSPLYRFFWRLDTICVLLIWIQIDSKLPETNEDIFISQEKEDRSQPATKPLQHDYADVGKSFTSFAEGQVWASNKQEQSLKKKSRDSFVEDPDSRTSSGGKPFLFIMFRRQNSEYNWFLIYSS